MKGEQKELEAKMSAIISKIERSVILNDGRFTRKKAITQLLSIFTQHALSCLPEEKVICRDYQESSTYEAGIEEGHNQCRLITKENIERR